MCSGCSGHYEGDSDDWGPASALSGDNLDGQLLERGKSVRHGGSRTETRRHGGDATRDEGAACQHCTDPDYEYQVLVSADEIIEIHRIVGNSGGFA